MIAALRWIVFAIAALAMNFPILVTLVTSFKSARELSTNPGLWVRAPTFDNYLTVFHVSERLNIFLYLANSMAVALLGTGLAVALALPAAYAIARVRSASARFCRSSSICAPCRSSSSPSRST